jgi:hypothetical protein
MRAGRLGSLAVRGFALATPLAILAIACVSACETNILLGARDLDDTADGGGSGGTTIGDGSPRTDGFTGDPCTDYANNLCELEQSCNLLVFRNLLWGDLAICKERRKARCAARLAAPSSNETAARVGACTAVISKFTCEDYGNQDKWPEACGSVGGNLVDGAPCALGAQCRGRACFPPEGSACGVCSVLPPIGSPCNNGACDEFLECLNGVCVAYLRLGDSCRYGGPLCGYGLACIGAASGQGKCLQHLGLGATCDPGAIECNDTIGLTCDNATGKCRLDSGLPGPGEPCFGGQYCRADAWCNIFINRCDAKRRDGESCGNTVGAPACLQPATCVGNTCVLPNGSACP